MIIKIIEDKDSSIILTDESLNNNNFIEIVFKEEVAIVPIAELLCAVKAFDDKRSMELDRENKLK